MSTTFSRNVVDGRIAESIIEQLFLENGYDVFRFGIENTAPSLSNQLGNRPKTRSIVSKMPDFIVRKDGKAYPVEVKFRGIGGKFDIDDLEGKDKPEYPYDKVFFIVITLNEMMNGTTRCEFKCTTIEDLRNGCRIDRESGNLLADCPEFTFDKDVLENLRSYAWAIFSGYKSKDNDN